MQASVIDPDDTVDALGQPVQIQYAWSVIAPGAAVLPWPSYQQLFTEQALQQGTLTFPPSSLSVSANRRLSLQGTQ